MAIVIPIPEPPCPEIKVSTFKVTSGYADCVQGTNRFEIITQHTPPENCTDDAGECKFGVELEIFVPIPRPPCPKIEIKKFNVVVGYPVCDPPIIPPEGCGGPNRFVISKRAAPAPCDDPTQQDVCEFDVELEINIPAPKIPCPVINIKKFEVKSDYEKCLIAAGVTGGSNFSITPRIIPCTCDELERCEFDIELEIVVPLPEPPCPEIRVKEFKVSVAYPICEPQVLPLPIEGCGGQNKFTITKTPKPPACGNLTPEGCDFEVTLEINIPAPKIPCPVINIKKFEVKGDYVRCLPNGGGSTFTVTPRIIPCTCDELERCEFDFEIEINVPIPEPPCPDISVKNFNVNYFVSSTLPVISKSCNKFRITKTKVTPPCDDDTGQKPACEFELELELCVPVVVPPCPVIKVRTFKVRSQYKDCVQGDNKFVIEPVPVGGDPTVSGSGSSGACEFNVDLEINVPIPRPPCPLFGTNVFIQTGLTGCIVPAVIFDVIPFTVPGNCDTAEQCAFVFDLVLQIPFPRFVSDVFLTPLAGKVAVNWCPVGANPAGSKATIDFKRQANFWAGACDRGDAVWYTVQFDLDIVVPRFPCEYIKLKPKPGREQVPIRRTSTRENEYLKLIITPVPNQGAGCAPCEFQFDFDVQLRCPCRAVITTQSGQVYAGECYDTTVPNTKQPPSDPNDPTPAPQTGGVIWLDVTRTKICGQAGSYGDPNDCIDEFTLTPYIELPPPKFKCPEFYSANRVKIEFYENYVQLPYGDLRFEPVAKIDPCDPCVFDVYLDLNLPAPCVPTFTFNPLKSRVNPCVYTTRKEWNDGFCNDPYYEVTIESVGFCKYEVYTYSKPAVFVPDLVCDEFVTSPQTTKVNYLTDENEPPRVDLKIMARDPGPDDEYCTYDVTFDLYIHRGCVPKFEYVAGESKVEPCYYSESNSGCTNDPVEVHIVPYGDPADPCKYKVTTVYKPHIYEPKCPYIYSNLTITPVSDWQPTYASPTITFNNKGYTQDGQCEIEMTGTVYVPEQNKKCPYIWYSPGGFRVIPVDNWIPQYESPTIEFRNVGYTPDGRCSIEIFGDLLVPKASKRKTCDEFYGDVKVNWAAWNADPSGTLTITAQGDPDDDTEKCTYDAVLDIYIPKCEPQFVRGAQYVNIFPTTTNPSGSLNVNINKLSGCEYNVNADLTLYLPRSNSRVEVRNKSANWLNCGSDPTLSVTITPPDQNGVQFLDISIGIPRPPNYIGDTWTVTDSAGGIIGTATSSVEVTGCNRKVGGFIQLFTTTCPPPPVQNFTAMPMTEGPVKENTAAADLSPAPSIMSLWDSPNFVDGFIAALQTNDRLRAAVKTLLQE